MNTTTTTNTTYRAATLPQIEDAVHPAVRLGHVHLCVADLERAISFYRDALGLSVTADARQAGVPVVLLAAGDYHHHIARSTQSLTCGIRGRSRRPRPHYWWRPIGARFACRRRRPNTQREPGAG